MSQNLKQAIKDELAANIMNRLEDAYNNAIIEQIRRVQDYNFSEDVRFRVMEKFAEKYVNENYTELMMKIDMEQVTKMLTLAIVAKAQHKN